MVDDVERVWHLTRLDETAGGAPLIPPVYDLVFGIMALLIVAVTILAIVLIVRSRLSATFKIVLIAVSLAAPLVGGVAAVLAVSLERKRTSS